MFWVFCNTCFIKPGQGGKRQFFMTSCSHILCSQCTKPDSKVCRRCQAPCMIVECNSQMPDEVKEVFCDVNEKIPNIIKVFDFQVANRTKLLSHYRNVFHKYNGAKAYVNELEKKFTLLQKKYESTKNAILQLQANNDQLTKKCQWYKQKIGSLAPHARIGESPRPAGMPSPISNLHLTPRNSQNYRSQEIFYTPDSVVSSHKSSTTSSSTHSNRGSISGLTPPSKTFQLLSLVNKSRKSPSF